MKNIKNISMGVIFVSVNIALFLFSYNNATFIEGADATQYLDPALSFLEYGKFLSNDGSLFTFGTPLYSILLAISIYIFDIENLAITIVCVQCTLLYMTGYLSTFILKQFTDKFAFILHSLVIFNPNSLITAHLVQSETLFTFLLVCAIVVAFKVVNNFSLSNILLLGFITGLSVLTRPVALYLLFFWPLFIFVALIVKSKTNNNLIYKKQMWAFKLPLIIVIGGLVISPWYYRNYAGFDRMFLTSNSGAYLKAQFLQLKNKGSGLDIMSADIKHKKALSNYLVSNNKSNFCLDNERHVSCDKIVANSTIIMILDEPLQSHAPALLNSWATLFFSGGASNIRNYLGLDGKSNIINFQNKSFNGFNSIYDLIRNMPFSYFLIFSFTTLFSIITRVVGFFGLYYLFVNKKFRPYGVILTEILFIFTSAYLYLGQSRFRVPLDPILMLFTVIGILYIVKTVELNKRKDVEIK